MPPLPDDTDVTDARANLCFFGVLSTVLMPVLPVLAACVPCEASCDRPTAPAADDAVDSALARRAVSMLLIGS